MQDHTPVEKLCWSLFTKSGDLGSYLLYKNLLDRESKED